MFAHRGRPRPNGGRPGAAAGRSAQRRRATLSRAADRVIPAPVAPRSEGYPPDGVGGGRKWLGHRRAGRGVKATASRFLSRPPLERPSAPHPPKAKPPRPYAQGLGRGTQRRRDPRPSTPRRRSWGAAQPPWLRRRQSRSYPSYTSGNYRPPRSHARRGLGATASHQRGGLSRCRRGRDRRLRA
jgi:hypothetical protein